MIILSFENSWNGETTVVMYDYMINYVRVQRKVNVGGEGDERSGRHF
jgi:hypothetical protein